MASLYAAAVAAAGKVTGDWSSVIGIVTSIIGNILISFALNTQRYAHIQLDKEQRSGEAELSSPTGSSKNLDGASAEARGRVQREEHAGEERRSINARADPPRDSIDEENYDEDAEETDALLPHVNQRRNGSRKEFDDDDDEDDDGDDTSSVKTVKGKRKSYLKSPYWWVGIVLMIVGEAGNFLAYGFAPASIVSPLGVVAIISNCLIAPCMLREQFRKRDLLGVLIAVGGAVTVVVSAEGSNPKLGPDEILDLVRRWEFLTYLGITVGVIPVLMVLSNKIGQKSILIDLGLVGLLGGYTALSTKGVASLLSYRLWFTLTFPIFYVLVAILVATAVLQIKYVNRALQRFDSTRVIPTQFCSFTISVIVGSAVLYRDFESATPQKTGIFVGGCLLTFLGVWFLTSARRDDSNGDDSNRMPDEEQGIDLVDDDPHLSRSTTSTIDARPNPTTPTPKPNRNSFTSSTQQSFKSARSHPGDTPTPIPRLSATESSPLIPTISTSASSTASSVATETPQRHSRHSSLMATPPFGPSSSATPGGTASASHSRHRSLAPRPSLAHIDFSPGPLTSPLSSGLSVVVADQRGRLRRGSSLRESAAAAAASGRGPLRGSVGRAVGASPGRPLGGGNASSADVSDQEGASAGAPVVLAERPRAGRGNTAEVVPGVRDGEAQARSGQGSGKGV